MQCAFCQRRALIPAREPLYLLVALPGYSSQLFVGWSLHIQNSIQISPLERPLLPPYLVFLLPIPLLRQYLFYCLYKAVHSVKLYLLFICFFVHFCSPNAQYSVNTVTRTTSSLFTTVAPVPRTIPDSEWTIKNYSRQTFMKLHGSLKETCLKADYKIACNVRKENGI